jgi:hypothetical protein
MATLIQIVSGSTSPKGTRCIAICRTAKIVAKSGCPMEYKYLLVPRLRRIDQEKAFRVLQSGNAEQNVGIYLVSGRFI